MAMPYDDYPKAASEEARKALRHKESYGSSCGTAVGWARANQLAKREAISEDVVKRTYSFLSRSKVYDKGDFLDSDGNEICGSVSYAAWGGDPMLRWTETIVNNLQESERTMDELKITRHNRRQFRRMTTSSLSPLQSLISRTLKMIWTIWR